MRKIITIAVLTSFVLNSCLKERENPGPGEGRTPAVFTAMTVDPMTRTTLSGNDIDGYDVTWQNGDEITIDIPSRVIRAKLSKAEIAARAKKAKKWSPRIKGGWLERYARFVGNASTGASLKG